MPGSWPISDNSLWEVNQDGISSLDLLYPPGISLSHSSPLSDCLANLSFQDPPLSNIFDNEQHNEHVSVYPPDFDSRVSDPLNLETSPNTYAHSIEPVFQDYWQQLAPSLAHTSNFLFTGGAAYNYIYAPHHDAGRVTGPSHAITRSAPPSPYRQSLSVDEGTRRHSESSGGSDRPLSLASLRQEAVYRSQRATSQTSSVFSEDEDPPVPLKKFGNIASPAALKASYRRRDNKRIVFPCRVCSQTLTTRENLRSEHQLFPRRLRSNVNIDHNDVHKGFKRHICSYCGRRFTTKSDMKRHQNSKICPAPKPYVPRK